MTTMVTRAYGAPQDQARRAAEVLAVFVKLFVS